MGQHAKRSVNIEKENELFSKSRPVPLVQASDLHVILSMKFLGKENNILFFGIDNWCMNHI